MNRALYLTRDRYIAALKRQRDRIAKGLKLKLVDCDETGNKETSATWGLCSNEPEAWPDTEDHLWPNGPIVPKYRLEGQCPFDRGLSGSTFGCFYRCALFKPIFKHDPSLAKPDRRIALALYDARIVAAKGNLQQQQVCAICGKPAECYGSYEGSEPAFACGDCCAHGNEDGRCVPTRNE